MTTPEPTQEQDPPSFEEALANDPSGAPLLDRLERLMALIAVVSTLATGVLVDLEVSLGWATGAFVSAASVVGVRRLMRRLLSNGVGKWSAAMILSVKLVVVLAVVYLVLTQLPASPIAFALGHVVVVSGLVIGSVLFAPRP